MTTARQRQPYISSPLSSQPKPPQSLLKPRLTTTPISEEPPKEPPKDDEAHD